MNQSPPPSIDSDGPASACLVVVRNRLYRDLVAGWIADHARGRVTVRAADHAAATVGLAAWVPDVLVLEVSGLEHDGLAVAEAFLTRRPAGRLIVLMDAAAAFAPPPPWLAGRVAAVIGSVARLDDLEVALAPLLGREVPTPGARHNSPANRRRLSQREREVLRLIGEGLASDSIAARLGIAVNTVATHRKRIAAKLGTRGNQLTRYAVRMRDPT
jgi:DNA-binding NarL/FixJ family response regulator